MDSIWNLIVTLAQELEASRIAYTYMDDAALLIQGVELSEPVTELTVNVQWDQFPDSQALFSSYDASPVEKHAGSAAFTFTRESVVVRVVCSYNTVIVTDKERIAVEHDGHTVYAKSLFHYRRTLAPDDSRQDRITARLRVQQRQLSAHNAAAWGHEDAYAAWVNRFGQPEQAAARIKKDPLGRLKDLAPYIGDVAGKKVANLLGSHGSKAVAMALLGADSTVVDISASNAAYASELAEAADVRLRYVVSDLLELPAAEQTGDYDLVFMENGILHYFVDLLPVARLIAGLLRPGGRLVLQDFHPISTKLITSKGKKHKVTGNYFDMSLQETNVAYSVLLEGQPALQSRLRKWTLGEIVTALADGGLFIRQLSEDPNTKIDDMGLPKMYTLIAEKR